MFSQKLFVCLLFGNKKGYMSDTGYIVDEPQEDMPSDTSQT